MYIVDWQNDNRRFIFKKNGENFVQALLDRGHTIKLKYTDIAGTTFVKVA